MAGTARFRGLASNNGSSSRKLSQQSDHAESGALVDDLFGANPDPTDRQKSKLMRAGRKAIHTFGLATAFDTKEFRDSIQRFLQTEPSARTESMIKNFVHRVVKGHHYKFFNAYTEVQQKQLAKVALYRTAKKDDMLFKQEDMPDALYLVIQGRASIFKVQGENKKVVGVAGSGDSFGDLNHLDDKNRRNCSAQVSSDELDAIVFERDDLDALAHEWRTNEEGEKAAFIARNVPVLNSVPREQLFTIASHFERVKVPKDTVIYRQQDDANAIYMIWEGTVQLMKRIDLVKVTKKGGSKGMGVGSIESRRSAAESMSYETGIPAGPRRSSKSIQLGILSLGEYFGEVELFNEITRTSASVSTTDCVLLVINKVGIESMPSNFLDAIYRYSFQRVQWRNSRMHLLFDCLQNINWVPERDAKLALEPEIKPLAKMKTALLPLETQPGSDRRGWLGAHTVMSEDDAREWSMYHYGPWARPPDKGDQRFISNSAEDDGRPGTDSRRPLMQVPKKDGCSFFQMGANKIGGDDRGRGTHAAK